MTAFEMSNTANNNLSQTVATTNKTVEVSDQPKQTINLNGSYMFTDEESMNSLLNKIGLAVQRQGGK